MLTFMTVNGILTSTSCYMSDKFEPIRILMFTIIVLFCFGVLIYWGTRIATPNEFDLFFWGIVKALAYLFIGFIFYITKFPERCSNNYWVQQCLHAHMWWHIFTFLEGYTLFWVLHESLIHMETSINEII
jgi:predicted membrane channel-forming protein YqfA (hemolysin III family)